MAPVHGKMSVVPLAPRPDLKLFRPQSPFMALGLAVNHLMTKPAFAKLRFGDWSRILVGQINRKHYCFAVDSKNQIQGFMGWALTSKEKAEAWVEGRGALSFADNARGSRSNKSMSVPSPAPRVACAARRFRDGDGFGRPFVGGFDCPEVLAALAQQRDAPSPELLGLSL